MTSKLWGLRLVFNIASIYFVSYVLGEWILNFNNDWLKMPTWFIFFIIMIVINILVWIFDEQEEEIKDVKRRKNE